MYNISQLNDLVVPELLDIADQLGIPGTRKMNKHDLIDHIITKQSQMAEEKKTPDGEKPKRKRILKSAAGTQADDITKVDHAKKEVPKHKKAEAEKKPFKKLIPEI